MATKEYRVVLMAEQRRKGEDIAVYDLQNIMFQHYQQMKKLIKWHHKK
jgi:hypothetical protein